MTHRTSAAYLAAALALPAMASTFRGTLPAPSEAATLSYRLNDLERTVSVLRARVATLERGLATASPGQKVVAPFVVVDAAGVPIFEVRTGPRGVVMTTSSGKDVAWISALDIGGVFKAQSANVFPEVAMGAVGTLGAVTIRDGANADRVKMTLSNGKATVMVLNASHFGIAALKEGPFGGGFLSLGNAAGDALVEAGATKGMLCGRVDTYPQAPSGRGMVGAAPTFLLGAAKC